MDKRRKRSECFARIKNLKPEEKAIFSEKVSKRLAENPRIKEARTIFSYLALPSEPNLQALFELFPEKHWAFSRVDESDTLRFHALENPNTLIKSEFGFLEPDPKRNEEIQPEQADLILIPGVGFDPVNMARLGRGKGHYDRFLARAKAVERGIHRIGVCFGTQLTSLVPEEHDIPMSSIVTELR